MSRAPSQSSETTRAALRAAATDTLRLDGIAGLSARVIAGRAGVNQALIFYHFGSVTQLVDAACRVSVEEALDRYRERLAGVDTLVQLLDVGRDLHEHEQARGNVAVMAQLLAGAQQDAELAATARFCLERWHAEIAAVLRRLLADSPIRPVVDPDGLAHAVSASFLGLELYEGAAPDGATAAFAALEQLAILDAVMTDLGPVARRALRARLRRRNPRAKPDMTVSDSRHG